MCCQVQQRLMCPIWNGSIAVGNLYGELYVLVNSGEVV